MIHLTENSIIGEHYNSLTIIDVIGEKFGYPHVLCICICGKTTTTDYYSISHNRKNHVVVKWSHMECLIQKHMSLGNL